METYWALGEPNRLCGVGVFVELWVLWPRKLFPQRLDSCGLLVLPQECLPVLYSSACVEHRHTEWLYFVCVVCLSVCVCSICYQFFSTGHIHRVHALSANPFHHSSVISAISGNNEVSTWNMETTTRQKMLWASPLPPFSKMTDDVSCYTCMFVEVYSRLSHMFLKNNLYLCFFVHVSFTVVCCVAQENRAHANGVSILTGRTNLQFSWASWCLSRLAPNLQWSCYPYRGTPHFKSERNPCSCLQDTNKQNFIKLLFFFFFFPSSFSHTLLKWL